MKRIGVLLVSLAVAFNAWPPSSRTLQAGGTLLAEGKDFATQVLRDPWDMDSITDVSMYLNRSGQAYDTQNIQFANGVFSAQATGTADTNFSVLFPGYPQVIEATREGALYPISSATYRCLYVAMQVEGSGNFAQVLWFEDNLLNTGPYWGTSNGTSTADSRWTVYAWNLANTAHTGTGWNSRPAWQGLRIDPSNQANRRYEVDWVRLTDCAAVNHTVTWQPSGNVNAIWVRPAGTTRDILAMTGVSGNAGSAQLDVQGLQPGTYAVRLGTSTACCSLNAASGDVIVNQAPIAHFVTPSFISGPEYSAQSGDVWDFANAADLSQAVNLAATVTGGQLDTTTQSGPLPAGNDAQLWLNSPSDLNGSQYRYLVFRMNTEWMVPWPNITDGMVARWIWSIPGASGQPANRCYLVSHDIGLDISWNTYVVDLHDAFNGQPEETSVTDCPGQTPSWASSGSIKDLRFDPNENVTVAQDPITAGGPFHQVIDWIRLAAPDRVPSGTPYVLQIDLNRPASQVTSVNYYYTTNRSDPTQTAARRWSPPGPSGPNRVFLSFLSRGAAAAGGADTLPQADLSFTWDTRGVAANTYYLCAVITITPNTVTHCSAAPLIVQ